ncbi:MAG: ABC transporter permease [Candidatus Hodarchaeota archaeon]
MKINKLIQFAMKNTFRKKGIALLAVVGIGIGVTLQITLNSYGHEMKATFNELFEELSGLIYIIEKDRASIQSYIPLNISQVIRSNSSLNEKILAISPEQDLPSTVNSYVDDLGENEIGIPYSISVIGIGALDEFKKVSKTLEKLENESRLFNSGENECVIPYELFDLNRTLFSLGNSFTLGINDTFNYNLTIVGITAKEQAEPLTVTVNNGFIVYTSSEVTRKVMREILKPENRYYHYEAWGLSSANLTADSYTTITVRTNIKESTDLENYSKQVKKYMETQFGRYYHAITLGHALDEAKIAEDQFTGFIEIIALVTVLAGGMGIVIAQLVGVESRLKEFAILKATGWSNRHILLDIIIESVFLGLIGSIMGVIVSMGVVVLSANLFPTLGDVKLSNTAVVQSIAIAIIIGIIGGSYPGIRAGSVRPIEILHGN